MQIYEMRSAKRKWLNLIPEMTDIPVKLPNDLWKQHIAEIFLPICTSGLVQRCKYGKRFMAVYAIATTSQGNVVICQKQTLIKAGPFPFCNCTELRLFRVEAAESTEYLVATSLTEGVALVSLIDFKVKDSWTNATSAEISDWNNTGSPQLRITFTGGESKIWNEHLWLQESEPQSELFVILKHRLQTAQENLNAVKYEINNKKRVLVSTLSRFHKAESRSFCSELPNLVPILKTKEPSATMENQISPMLTVTPVTFKRCPTGLHIEFSVANLSKHTVENLHCFVTSSEVAGLTYHISGENGSSLPKLLQPENSSGIKVSVDYPISRFPTQKLNLAVSGIIKDEPFCISLKPIQFTIDHHIFGDKGMKCIENGESNEHENEKPCREIFPCRKTIHIQSYMHDLPDQFPHKLGDPCMLEPLDILGSNRRSKSYYFYARDRSCLKQYIHAFYSALPDDALILPVPTSLLKGTEKETVEECLNCLLRYLYISGVSVKTLPLSCYRDLCGTVCKILSE